MAFVQDFLVPSIVKKMGFPGVMGAYILDSVMAFNDTVDSQVVKGMVELYSFICQQGVKIRRNETIILKNVLICFASGRFEFGSWSSATTRKSSKGFLSGHRVGI